MESLTELRRERLDYPCLPAFMYAPSDLYNGEENEEGLRALLDQNELSDHFVSEEGEDRTISPLTEGLIGLGLVGVSYGSVGYLAGINTYLGLITYIALVLGGFSLVERSLSRGFPSDEDLGGVT